jgi:hypothetical protein
MRGLQPIPVIYSGILFRSTLEADWAEYFDRLHLHWFYEPEALKAGSTSGWLPDFYLPELKLFVECKAWQGERLPKVGIFVRTAMRDVLICFPQGRFALCSHYDWLSAESGRYEEGRLPLALMAEDWGQIKYAMKTCTCMATDESGDDVRFLNYGEFCPDYCGYEPDYWNSMKDRTGPDGRDARSHYWGGYSTWAQRGFAPSRHQRV